MHHARHTYVRGVRINRRTRKRRKRKELELQTKTPMTMTPSAPAQLHPRIITEIAPEDLSPLFNDIPDDDYPVINWFNIYKLTPPRRIRGIRRKPSRNYCIFNPQPCERKGKCRRNRRQQTPETFQIPPPTLIPKYFILPTVLMAIFSTRLHTDTCHAFDEANLHAPLPTLSFSTNAGQMPSPPRVGRRQRTSHKDINGITDTTKANYKTIFQQYEGTDAPAQQYKSQSQQYKGIDAPAQTKSFFQQYKGPDDPAQSKSHIQQYKGPDAPAKTESNVIIIHPESKGPDAPAQTESIIIKGHDAPAQTESNIIIHPEFPMQQNNLFMPSPKKTRQFCPLDPIPNIIDEQHHLPQFHNESYLMRASTILAPIAILLIAIRLHRRTQQSAISYSKSSASADAEARPLP